MKKKVVYMPQYGLGSWLQENAGTVGAVAGGLVGGPIGASIGGGIGGVIQGGYDKQQQMQAVKGQQALLNKQAFINSYNSNPSANPIQYANNFANGGIMIKPKNRGALHAQLGVKQGQTIPSTKLAIKEGDSQLMRKRKQFAINAKKWQHADGGLLNSTSGIDGITMYPASAGTHESSKTQGITIGNYGKTEGSEVRFGKYVFSNRF
jgi:hypothetical protein